MLLGFRPQKDYETIFFHIKIKIWVYSVELHPQMAYPNCVRMPDKDNSNDSIFDPVYTYVYLGGPGEGSCRVDIVVKDDYPHHHTQTEGHSVLVGKAATVLPVDHTTIQAHMSKVNTQHLHNSGSQGEQTR